MDIYSVSKNSPNDRFGSLAVVQHPIRSMSAFGQERPYEMSRSYTIDEDLNVVLKLRRYITVVAVSVRTTAVLHTEVAEGFLKRS